MKPENKTVSSTTLGKEIEAAYNTSYGSGHDTSVAARYYIGYRTGLGTWNMGDRDFGGDDAYEMGKADAKGDLQS